MGIAHATDHCMQMVNDLLELCMALQMHDKKGEPCMDYAHSTRPTHHDTPDRPTHPRHEGPWTLRPSGTVDLTG